MHNERKRDWLQTGWCFFFGVWCFSVFCFLFGVWGFFLAHVVGWHTDTQREEIDTVTRKQRCCDIGDRTSPSGFCVRVDKEAPPFRVGDAIHRSRKVFFFDAAHRIEQPCLPSLLMPHNNEDPTHSARVKNREMAREECGSTSKREVAQRSRDWTESKSKRKKTKKGQPNKKARRNRNEARALAHTNTRFVQKRSTRAQREPKSLAHRSFYFA